MMPASSGIPTTQTTASEVLGGSSGSTPSQTPPKDESPNSVTQEANQNQTDKISPKLQLLIQREKTALERERAAKTKEAQALAKEQSLAAREAKLQEFESLRATNPMKALELLGLSYNDLTQIALADGNITPDIKLKQLEDKFEGFTKSQEEALRVKEENERREAEKQSTQVIDKFKGEINSYIKDNSARYELIEFEQSHELVYDVINEHYDRTLKAATDKAELEGLDPADCRGEVMTIAQASDKVELHLEQKYNKARELKKVGAFLAQRQEKKEPVSAGKPTPKTPSQTQKTLTNNLSARSQPSASTRPLTDDERIAKAIAYAKGLRSAA